MSIHLQNKWWTARDILRKRYPKLTVCLSFFHIQSVNYSLSLHFPLKWKLLKTQVTSSTALQSIYNLKICQSNVEFTANVMWGFVQLWVLEYFVLICFICVNSVHHTRVKSLNQWMNIRRYSEFIHHTFLDKLVTEVQIFHLLQISVWREITLLASFMPFNLHNLCHLHCVHHTAWREFMSDRAFTLTLLVIYLCKLFYLHPVWTHHRALNRVSPTLF